MDYKSELELNLKWHLVYFKFWSNFIQNIGLLSWIEAETKDKLELIIWYMDLVRS